jgi:hypothetical protein
MDLSEYGKSLLKLIKEKDHPLERYIFAIDLNLDDPSLLKVIGEKIGIDVYNDSDPAYSLYLILEDYLKNEKDVNKTKRKIDITLTEFSKQYPSLTAEESFTFYANRLLN